MSAGGAPAVDVTPMFSEEAVEQLLFGCPSDRRGLSNMPEAADTHLPAGTFRCAQHTMGIYNTGMALCQPCFSCPG